VRAAAALYLFGMDGMRLLATGDRTEALVLQAVAEEALRLSQIRDRNLAVEIANAVGRLFK
jgi:hypothetical protein